MMILQKRMASSLHAIRKSLQNRLGRLQELLRVGEQLQLSHEQENLLEQLEEEGLGLDDLDEENREELEKSFELLTMATNIDELKQEISQLKRLIGIAERINTDSKSEELLRFVKELLDADPQEKVLVFTEYRDTLSYLVDCLEEKGYKMAIIHGGMSLD